MIRRIPTAASPLASGCSSTGCRRAVLSDDGATLASPSQRRSRRTRRRRRPRGLSAAGGRRGEPRHSVTCGVQCPGRRVGGRPVTGARRAAGATGRAGQQARGRHDEADQDGAGRARTPAARRPRSASGRLLGHRPQQVVGVLGDPVRHGQRDVGGWRGRCRAWLGRSASASAAHWRRMRRLGVGVEEQLDRMDHQLTRLCTQSASNASALIAAKRSADRSAARRRAATARTGASPCGAPRGLDASAGPARGQLPITSPAHERPCAARDSTVSAVWLRVPSSALTTTSTAAPRSTARSRSVTASARELDEQAAGALDQRQPPGSVQGGDQAQNVVARRQRGRRPARRRRPGRAARIAPGRASSVTPDSRATSARSSSPSSVAGLHRFAHRDVDAGPAGRGRPAPPWRPSCRRRCRCP